MAPGFQRLVRPLETRGIMKVSLWQAGLPAGRAGRQHQACRQQRASEAGQFPLSHPSLWSVSVWEEGVKRSRMGEAFKEDSGEKKAETPSPRISNCFSGEVSLHTVLEFREKRTRAGAGAGAGAWRQRAQEPPTWGGNRTRMSRWPEMWVADKTLGDLRSLAGCVPYC